MENVVDTSSPIADIYEMKTAHLTPSQTAFFKKWEALISLEEQDLVRFKKELWTMGAAEREVKGRCFSSMVLDTTFRAPVRKVLPGGIHSFTYKFMRAPAGGKSGSFLSGQINTGDAVTVSVEPGLLALARGFITELTPTEVVIGVDHELKRDNILERLGKSPLSTSPASDVVFRIDKDELFGGMGRIRDNLAQLFYADGDTRRLKLVVDLVPPVFAQPLASPSLLTPLTPSLLPYSSHLNVNQQQAVKRILSAQDYALVLGMPGTGKTTVIAAVIRTLVAMGKTVLLTSYTHSAVDNIIVKLLRVEGGLDGVGILRLGNLDKVCLGGPRL